MIIVDNITASVGQEVSIGITSDEPILGLNFTLHFDPGALAYLDTVLSAGAGGNGNLVDPGAVKVAASRAVPLEQPCCWINFTVNGASALALEVHSASKQTSDTDPTPIDFVPEIQNGEITIEGEEEMINIKASWSNMPPEIEAAHVFMGDGPDPAANTFELLGAVQAPGTSLETSIDANQGDRWFFAVYLIGVRVGPRSDIVQLNTDQPIPVPEGFTVEIVG